MAHIFGDPGGPHFYFYGPFTSVVKGVIIALSKPNRIMENKMFKLNKKYRMKNVDNFIAKSPFCNKAIGEMFNYQGLEFTVLEVDEDGVNKIEFNNGFVAYDKGFKLHKSEVNAESIKDHHYIWLSHDELNFFKEVKSNKDDLEITVNSDNALEMIELIKAKFNLK